MATEEGKISFLQGQDTDRFVSHKWSMPNTHTRRQRKGLSRCHTHMCDINNQSKVNQLEKDERNTGGAGEGEVVEII